MDGGPFFEPVISARLSWLKRRQANFQSLNVQLSHSHAGVVSDPSRRHSAIREARSCATHGVHCAVRGAERVRVLAWYIRGISTVQYRQALPTPYSTGQYRTLTLS